MVVSLGVLQVVEGVDLIVELLLLRCLLILFRDSFGVLDCCLLAIVVVLGCFCVFSFSITL